MSVISGESKFDLDIGATTGGVLVWDVFAPEEGPKRRALAGNYEGVGASATVGVGLGANALAGGSNRSVALQPLSTQMAATFTMPSLSRDRIARRAIS